MFIKAFTLVTSIKLYLVYLILGSIFSSCQKAPDFPEYGIKKSAVSRKAMIVSAHPLATRAGIEILEKGGNAIDAAVAVQLALAVTYPRAGNIGGGGFMVIRTKDGETATLDYREKAPEKASRNMYLDSLGNVIPGLSQNGHLAVGVPGTVDGLTEAHKKYGKIPDFRELIEPAIRLASKGFQLTATEIDRLNYYQESIKKFNDAASTVFAKEEQWEAGDRLVQPELARTLERIRDNGRAGFYEGKTADYIVAEMQSANGLISHEDLKNYRSQWRKPITGQYKNYKIISMPPPSSGGIALVQLLKMAENYPLGEWGFHTPRSIHLICEAERRVYADRAKYLGDSDFYKVPTDSLLNGEYLMARMADFDIARATTSDQIMAGQFKLALESFETTHTSIIDDEGNAVSVTTTLNSNYGSKVVVDGAGFFLNNEMDDFSAKPGIPNQFGLVGAEANSIQPGKRMLSSMTPTIVEKDGKLFLVIGAPGGSTIITAVFQVFLNVAEYGMSLEEAVNAGRFHHQWLPDEIMIEEGVFEPSVKEKLSALGHQFREIKSMAVIKAIQVLPDGSLNGVGDRRNPDDHAEGL